MKYLKLLCLSIIAVFAVSCSSTKVQSDKFNTAIVVNGEKSDWLSNTSKYTLHYFEDQNTTVGVTNDDNFVYFYLMTNNRANSMQILNLGLQVNIKSAAGEFTFEFPEKRNMREVYMKRMESARGNEESGSEQSMFQDSSNMKNITIIDSHGEAIEKIPHLHNRYGLEAAASMDENNAVIYEFQVPILKDKSGNYGILPDDGKFSVEMKTEMPERNMKRKNQSIEDDPGGFGGVNGGMGGGMQGGMGGMGGGMRGGGAGRMGRSMPEAFDLSFDVIMSK